MSTLVRNRRKNSVAGEQVIIIILLVALVSTGLLAVYRYMNIEPAISPNDLDIKRLTENIESNPNNKNEWLQLAYTYQKNGDFGKAVEGYNEVLKINPNELAALYNLGVIEKEQNNIKAAEKYLQQVVSIKKEHVLGCIALGEIYLMTEKYNSALKVLDQAIKVQGTLVRPRIIKAKVLEQKGDIKNAIREYKEVLRFIPDQKEAITALQRLK